MEQRKKKEEKKRCSEIRMGYCQFSFGAGSRYSKLYRDTAGLGEQQGATIRPTALRYGSTTRPGGLVTWPVCARGERQRARMAWPQIVSRYKFCIVEGGHRYGATTRSRARNTAMRYGLTRARHGAQCARQGLGHDTTFVS